jgi:hypothetical protein
MKSVIERVLDSARWAPSGDNTQPWRFEIQNESHAVIHGFDTRSHCLYDLNGFGSHIAHGALLETIRISASAHGVRIESSRREDSSDTNPIYDVYFYRDPNIEPEPLAHFIERRCTQRRPLSTRALTHHEKDTLARSVGDHQVLWIDGWEGRWAMSKLLFASAKLRLTIPEAYEVHRDVIEWNARESADRIPDAALGLDPMSLKLTRWAMHSWERLEFLNRYFAGHLVPRIQLDLLPALRCAAHFVLLRTEEARGIDDHVESGRVVQRFWLTATSLGLQLQPEMTPAIFAAYSRRRIPISRASGAVDSANQLASSLDSITENQSARIAFMGRIGHGPIPQARSARKPLPALVRPQSNQPLSDTVLQ